MDRETLEKDFYLKKKLHQKEFDLLYTLQIEEYTTNSQFSCEEIISWENTQVLKPRKKPKMSAVISLLFPKEEKICDNLETMQALEQRTGLLMKVKMKQDRKLFIDKPLDLETHNNSNDAVDDTDRSDCAGYDENGPLGLRTSV